MIDRPRLIALTGLLLVLLPKPALTFQESHGGAEIEKGPLGDAVKHAVDSLNSGSDERSVHQYQHGHELLDSCAYPPSHA